MYDENEDFSKKQLKDLGFGEQVDLILEALWWPQYKEWDDGESDRILYGVEDQEFDESTLIPQKHSVTAKMNNERVVKIKWEEEFYNGEKNKCTAYIDRYEHGHSYTVKGSGGSLGGSTSISIHLPGYTPPKRESGDDYAFIDWGSSDPIG